MRGQLTLLQPGFCTLLLDPKRPSRRALGVAVGGPADSWSLTIGNALVGNPPNTPALEIALLGPTLQADVPLVCVLCGAPFDLSTDRRTLQTGRTFTLEVGETLSIGGTARGLRAYLCIHGGLPSANRTLDALRAGTILACEAARMGGRFIREESPSLRSHPLRILPGPQAEWFDYTAFCAASFTVAPASNRMGLRLLGAPLAVPPRELVSEPVCPGTVQVTREGQCIILGCDGQTIGGYPRIAQVVSADLDRLGQLAPGDPVTFEAVSMSQAESLYREQQRSLREWLLRLSLSH